MSKLYNFKLLGLIFVVLYAVHLPAQVKNEQYFITLSDSVNTEYDKFDYKKAIDLSAKLIEEGKTQKSGYAQFMGYHYLGSIYKNLDEHKKSEQYVIKALETAHKTKIDSLIAWANFNCGNMYSHNPKDLSKAIYHYKKGLKYYSSKNRVKDVFFAHTSIAWALIENENYDLANNHMLEADKLSSEYEIDTKYLAYNKLLKGKYYYQKNELDYAESVLRNAARMVEEENSLFEIGEEIYHLLVKISLEKENFKEAHEYLSKEKKYSEANFKEKKLNAIQVASAKFDLQNYKSQLEISEKEKAYSIKRTQMLSLIVGVLILAVVGFVILLNSRRIYVERLRYKNQELLEAKEKTEKLSKVKNQFFSTVSHELRTPLYGVIGLSSILKDNIKLKEYEHELNSLKFSADYLLALINDVLLLNKIDYQNLDIEKVPFSITTIVESLKQSFKFSLEQNNNQLIIDIGDNVPNNILGSSVRLSQILMNLIGNATKFNENGTIWFTIKLLDTTEDGYYRTEFMVKDNGIGIPKDKQEVIFQEFSQVTSNNHSHKGTGLGLAIVKKLLKALGSDIKLKSNLGEGSEFSFILNLEKNNAVSSNKPIENSNKIDADTASNIDFAMCDCHILVVEDNKINQKITQTILKKYHMSSSLANDGEEAVEMTKKHNYDLILMDINMPKLDGIGATKIIRTFNKDTPIIALTALEIEEIRTQILESGMNDMLSKPYDASNFITTILKHLNISCKVA